MTWPPMWGRRTYLMGVINVTPDSFSGDGLYKRWEDVALRAEHLVAAGADVLDVGGESTRPGYQPVAADEELSRVIPAVRLLRQRVDVPISVDTSKSQVAHAALGEGASIVNDVSGLRDAAMLREVAEAGASIVLVHWGRRAPSGDLLLDIVQELQRKVCAAIEAGVQRAHILVDPGLGMGKGWHENFEIMRRLPEVRAIDLPVAIGPSRKGMIARVLGGEPWNRLEGSAALTALCVARGADLLRVHDVKEMSRVARVIDAIVRAPSI